MTEDKMVRVFHELEINAFNVIKACSADIALSTAYHSLYACESMS